MSFTSKYDTNNWLPIRFPLICLHWSIFFFFFLEFSMPCHVVFSDTMLFFFLCPLLIFIFFSSLSLLLLFYCIFLFFFNPINFLFTVWITLFRSSLKGHESPRLLLSEVTIEQKHEKLVRYPDDNQQLTDSLTLTYRCPTLYVLWRWCQHRSHIRMWQYFSPLEDLKRTN